MKALEASGKLDDESLSRALQASNRNTREEAMWVLAKRGDLRVVELLLDEGDQVWSMSWILNLFPSEGKRITDVLVKRGKEEHLQRFLFPEALEAFVASHERWLSINHLS